MHTFFLVFCLVVTTVMARPEPPLPYLGQQRTLIANNHAAKTHVYQQLTKEHGFSGIGALSPVYNGPEAVSSQDAMARVAPEMPSYEDSYNAAYRLSSTQHDSGYPNAPTETQVHKHIYVHVPPKDFEDEEMQPRVTHQPAPKQKHYKIVFIKAPSAPAIRAPVVPPPPQNEEKTLIYVLHKKPEKQPEIVIPTPAPTKPTKPEVYFIKYKTKKEEAPVYGPPPSNYEIQARSGVESSDEYDGAVNNEASDFAPMDLNQATTDQPQMKDVQSQLASEEQSGETYNAPTMPAFAGNDAQIAAVEPNSQYLAPETTAAPIVMADMEDQPRVPAASYGPPNHYFIKRRK